MTACCNIEYSDMANHLSQMCRGQVMMGKEAREGSWGLTRGTPIKLALESSGSNAEPQRSECLRILHIPSLPPAPSMCTAEGMGRDQKKKKKGLELRPPRRFIRIMAPAAAKTEIRVEPRM